MSEKKIPAGVFKNTCLKLIDEIYNMREAVIVTKRGIPMVRIIPIIPIENQRPVFASMRGTTIINGLGEEWEKDMEERFLKYRLAEEK